MWLTKAEREKPLTFKGNQKIGRDGGGSQKENFS